MHTVPDVQFSFKIFMHSTVLIQDFIKDALFIQITKLCMHTIIQDMHAYTVIKTQHLRDVICFKTRKSAMEPT